MISVRRRSLGFVISFAAAVIGGFFSGCQKHPYQTKIEAHDDMGFSLWISDHSSDLSADEQRQLTEAIQQIKLSVMTASSGLPSDEFARTVYADVNGHSVREVLLRGLDAQAGRISSDIAALEEREAKYQKVDAASLSPEAREFLQGFRTRMADRRTELQRFEERKALVRAHP